jgi:hypothetical protein
MATHSHQSRPSTTVKEFIAKHPEIQLGRAVLDKLQTDYSSGDTFSIVNKPFRNMVLYQEFDADTKRRLYVVALIDDQKALDYYTEASDEAAVNNSKCDCAEHQGPDHLIFDHMIEHKKADCSEHIGGEPDPACSVCWPVLCGGNCSPQL